MSYSDEIQKTHVALIHETWRQSLARDLSTVATFLFLWSIGYMAGSSALEWVGAVLGCLILVSRAVALLKDMMDKRMTPQEAREWLNRNFPEGE